MPVSLSLVTCDKCPALFWKFTGFPCLALHDCSDVIAVRCLCMWYLLDVCVFVSTSLGCLCMWYLLDVGVCVSTSLSCLCMWYLLDVCVFVSTSLSCLCM